MNFGIGSAFSKVPGFTFSEGQDPGPSLFHKVCRLIESGMMVSFTKLKVMELTQTSLNSLVQF